MLQPEPQPIFYLAVCMSGLGEDLSNSYTLKKSFRLVVIIQARYLPAGIKTFNYIFKKEYHNFE
jgi:hypothetical protein